jgi:hypothetical protein
VENIGVTHDDAFAWLTDTDDGLAYLREEVRARTKRGSIKRGTAKTFAEVLRGDETTDADDDDVGDGIDILDDDKSGIPDDLIDRVVEMFDGKFSRGEALQWIRGTPLGRELHHHSTSKTAGDNMDSIEKLKASRLQKLQDAGPVEIAKSILRGDDPNNLDLTEHEFVELVGTAAQKQHPNLSAAGAFAKAFTAQTEEGKLLRQARSKILSDGTPVSGFAFPR